MDAGPQATFTPAENDLYPPQSFRLCLTRRALRIKECFLLGSLEPAASEGNSAHARRSLACRRARSLIT